MKVCIDPGHGGRDSGATFRGALEEDIVLDVALEVERLLRYSQTIDTVMTRRRDSTIRLNQRVAIANDTHCDLFLSIHTNADPDDDSAGMPEAEGKEIWINPGSVKGKDFAEGVQTGFRLEFPDEPFRGIKERGLYVVRKTAMPAILTEIAFIDNSDSNRELRLPAIRKGLSFALVRGVLHYQRLHF